ncbi:hypothetical protein B4113_3823 [Geobacillus sp. B4113_201601]|nr:hypothetical protein B4113_3823 [Geobacillus sp. B4113_201601]
MFFQTTVLVDIAFIQLIYFWYLIKKIENYPFFRLVVVIY